MTYTSAELESRLEKTLDAVLSSRRTVSDAASTLQKLDASSQDFVLHWLDVVSASNSELAYQFVNLAGHALNAMSQADVEAWIVDALNVYDQQGLFPATNALCDLNDFAKRRRAASHSVELKSQAALLERYIRGLSGRTMRIAAGEEAHTDTETLFLPKTLDRLPTTTHNRLLYKVMATHLWAMNRFGTFRRASPDAPSLSEKLRQLPHPTESASLFYLLEAERLNACIGRELPGIHRDIQQYFQTKPTGIWADACEDLSRPEASVENTLQWVRQFIDKKIPHPAAAPYQGYADLDKADELTQKRLDTERSELEKLIQELIDQMDRDDMDAEGQEDPELKLSFKQGGPATDYELTADGEPLAIPTELQGRIDAILQDLESIPDDWLTPDHDADAEQDELTSLGELPDRLDQDPMFYYNEWDYQRGYYRKDWCTLYERQVASEDPVFFDQTLRKHHGLVLDLRRAFELLREQQHTLRRQPEGEDIDLDAVVDAATEHHLGREVSDRLFLKTHRNERDIAVMFMVDLSGSTKGWIIDAEREALVLLCEALEVLGDRYGIYGFSGMTRKRCELFRIKTIGEALDDRVKARIAGMQPRDYTRMGVTIRHLTQLMEHIDARTRVLVTLSDGKPDDYDGYRGNYGIEDTRQALIEARNKGIHPFCITIDRHASEYLPHMYGAVNYTVVDDVRKLPAEVSKVYCRLTR